MISYLDVPPHENSSTFETREVQLERLGRGRSRSAAERMSDDFEQIVRRHANAVCAVAYSVLRDRARSEEIAQEAFLVAWQKLPSIDPPPALPAWICGIAKKLAANARRRKRLSAKGPLNAAGTGSRARA